MMRYELPDGDRPPIDHDVVIPTVGGPGLNGLLRSLAADLEDADPTVVRPRTVIVVDLRPGADGPLVLPEVDLRIDLVRRSGRCRSAGRNRGWARSTSSWVCFLDDDIDVPAGWNRALCDDLRAAGEDVAAVRGQVSGRRAVDVQPTARDPMAWGLEGAPWFTPDVAIRRCALAEVGGFDERSPQADREDSDIAFRLLDAGWRLTEGEREIDVPGDAAGGIDGASPGRRAPSVDGRARPGPDDRWETRRPSVVLFDRDGTLVDGVGNGDPDLVEPVDGARAALDRLRAAGVKVGLVSAEDGAPGSTVEQVQAVNDRVIEELGPFDTVQRCVQGVDDGCAGREPADAMLEAAADSLGDPLVRSAVIGDLGRDVEAGLSCGMRSILVPTAVTEADDVRNAPEVATSLGEAVDALLGTTRLPAGHQLRPRARRAMERSDRAPARSGVHPRASS